MTVESLESISPSPKKPRENVGDWGLVEMKIGNKLPEDYKLIISKYGSGAFGEFLYLLNPFSTLDGYDYFQHVQEILDAYKELKNAGGLDFNAFPSLDGLYPFAVTDNGDVLYWKVSTDTEDWMIVLYNSRHWKYEEYSLGIIEFLLRWLSGNLEFDIIEAPFSSSFSSY